MKILLCILSLFFVISCGAKNNSTNLSVEQNAANADAKSANKAEIFGNTKQMELSKYYKTIQIGSNTVKDRVFFDFDSHNLSPEAREVVKSQANAIKLYTSKPIVIEGYCDERGGIDYNIALGEKRANAVKMELARQGIDIRNIGVVSYGKENPIVTGSTEEAWQQNRTAVLKFKK